MRAIICAISVVFALLTSRYSTRPATRNQTGYASHLMTNCTRARSDQPAQVDKSAFPATMSAQQLVASSSWRARSCGLCSPLLRKSVKPHSPALSLLMWSDVTRGTPSSQMISGRHTRPPSQLQNISSNHTWAGQEVGVEDRLSDAA